MLTLGIETSGWDGSIALVKDEATIAESTLPREGRRHAQMLVPKIGELVESAGFRLFDLDQIAVSIGPGSFTGLRVGVVCAKTLAYALDCSLCPVMTLDVIAKKIPNDEEIELLNIISDAQREEIYLASYSWADTQWVRQGDVEIIPLEDWIPTIQHETLISGPGVKRHFDMIDQSNNVSIVKPSIWNPIASVVALCAQHHPQNSVNPMQLEPFYLRPSAAEEKWNQKSKG